MATTAENVQDFEKKSENKSTITVKGISQQSTEKTIRDFFAFCGKISSLKLVPDDGGTQKAEIDFEKESGAKTALMLTNATIDGATITVTAPHESVESFVRNGDESSSDPHSEEISQEDKPRAAIIAELLAHGYQMHDHIIARGIEFDQKYGISQKFQNYFGQIHSNIKSVDEKFHVTDKASTHAKSLDEKYRVQDQLKQHQDNISRIGRQYYEKALASPLGERVYHFYTVAQKQALDVHHEAKRISEQRTAAGEAAIPGIAATAPRPIQTQAIKTETSTSDEKKPEAVATS